MCPLREGLTIFIATPFVPLATASRTDFVTNVLLFMPIGFFLLGAAAPRGRVRAVAWLLPVAAVWVAASVAIEFSQVFFSGRTPSWDDVLAESIGGRGWRAGVGRDRSGGVRWFSGVPAPTRVTSASCACWRLRPAVGRRSGWCPSTSRVRPQELAEKFRAGRVVLRPFADHPGLETVLSVFLRSVPVGAFAMVLAAGAPTSYPVKVWALTIGIGAVGALEIGQLLTYSERSTTTDVVLGVAGVLAGIAVTARATGGAAQHPSPRAFGSGLCVASCCCGWC